MSANRTSFRRIQIDEIAVSQDLDWFVGKLELEPWKLNSTRASRKLCSTEKPLLHYIVRQSWFPALTSAVANNQVESCECSRNSLKCCRAFTSSPEPRLGNLPDCA
jgi:hypothetical protein